MLGFRFDQNGGSRWRQPWFGGACGALLAVVLGLALLQSHSGLDIGNGLRNLSYDLLFLPRSQVPRPEVMIVYLNEASYHDLNQDPANFDRSLYARLIRKLKADGAKMIVFDVLFIDPRNGSAAADRDLADAMREHGNVILGGQREEGEARGPGVPREFDVFPPIDALRDTCAGWGLVTVRKDGDFEARRHYGGTGLVPSLAWKSAEIYGAEIAKKSEARASERWLNYYCPEPFQRVAFSSALGTNAPNVSFKDKVVFVGGGEELAGNTGDLREYFRSPWTWLTGRFHLGVEIHALTFCNLVQRDWLWELPQWVQWILIILSGVVLGYGLSLFRPLAATGAAIVFAVAVLAVTLLLAIRFNLWFPWLIPVAAQLPLALGWSYLFQAIQAHVKTRILETSLALYLSPHQVKRIQEQPELLKPGGTQQTVSILFSDIAGFSLLSERMNPDDLVKLLNEFYETAIKCIHDTDGTVMSLIGDAIFALWNAPQAQADHQMRACRAALRLEDQLVHFNTARTHALRMRIGLHTGVVCVGNVGSTDRFDYTAIGESVNIASRVEGLNRHLGTSVLATRDIQQTVAASMVTRPVGRFRFKGFQKYAEIFELLSSAQPDAPAQPWLAVFEKALDDFQHRRFQAASEGFNETLRLRPDDGPAKYYLAKIDELRHVALPENWAGEIDMTEK